MASDPFDDIATTDPVRIWDGVLARTVEGARLSLAVVELDPGSVVGGHRHENEQLGFVVSGSVTFRIGEESRELRPGGTWQIPPNAPHEVARGPGRCGRDRCLRARKGRLAGSRAPAGADATLAVTALRG